MKAMNYYVALYDTEYLKRVLKMSSISNKTKDLTEQALKKTQPFLTLCINHAPISSATKRIKVHVCSATNPTPLPKKPERALTTLPTIAGNTSTAFHASLLSTSASLPNHLFSSPSSPLPRPKAPAVASTIAEMVIEREVSIEKIFIPCSRK